MLEGEKLKTLCTCSGDEDESHPFKDSHIDFPSELELIETFKEFREEFPDYLYFSFKAEEESIGCGDYETTWWLVGHKE